MEFVEVKWQLLVDFIDTSYGNFVAWFCEKAKIVLGYIWPFDDSE